MEVLSFYRHDTVGTTVLQERILAEGCLSAD
jgi:hypothetical protein